MLSLKAPGEKSVSMSFPTSIPICLGSCSFLHLQSQQQSFLTLLSSVCVFCPLRPRDRTRTIRHARHAQQLTLCTGERVCGPAACLPLRQTHLRAHTRPVSCGRWAPFTGHSFHTPAQAPQSHSQHTDTHTHTHKHRRATPETHTHIPCTQCTHTLHTAWERQRSTTEPHLRHTQTHTALTHTPRTRAWGRRAGPGS